MDTEQKPIDKPRVWILRVAAVVVWIIYLVTLTAFVLLMMAFVLRLLGANPDAGFVEWVYRSVDRVMEPFRGMFPSTAINDRSVLDFSLLFAALVYLVFAVLAHWLVEVVSRHLSRIKHPPAPPAPAPAPQFIVTAPPATTNVNVGTGAGVALPAPPPPPPTGEVPVVETTAPVPTAPVPTAPVPTAPVPGDPVPTAPADPWRPDPGPASSPPVYQPTES